MRSILLLARMDSSDLRRDFQLLVIDCNDDTPEQPIVMYKSLVVQEVSFCPEKPITLETETAADWSYQWQLNGLNIPGAISPIIMVSDTGNYSVVKSFVKKCSRDTASGNVHVTYQSPPEAFISLDKPTICKGDSGILLANGGSLAANLICSWTLDNISIPTNAAKVEITEAGVYRLLVTDQEGGCNATDSVIVNVEEVLVKLPDQITVTEGSQFTLSPKVNPDGLSYIYQWSPLDGIVGDNSARNIIIFPTQSTEYTLTIISPNGCSDLATIKINVIDKMHIPTAFSPNNDGYNDNFEIFNAKDQIQNIKIFNRWGEVIFNSDSYDEPWNGTYKNKPAPAGSYPYIIKASGKEYKGEILLLR